MNRDPAVICEDATLRTPQDRREHHEDWAYFHLTVARGCAIRISSSSDPLEIAADFTTRKNALARARIHLAHLRRVGQQPGHLLAEMARADDVIY